MADQIFYQDLPLDPTINSRGDISTVTNKEAIKQSLHMILNTGRGTRIFQPSYGARLRAFLFEPFDQMTATRMGKEIEETINNFEQRVQLLNINVAMVQATNSYEINITYIIVNQQQVDSYKVTLEKL